MGSQCKNLSRAVTRYGVCSSELTLAAALRIVNREVSVGAGSPVQRCGGIPGEGGQCLDRVRE